VGRLVKLQRENNERVRYLDQIPAKKDQKVEEARLREVLRKPDKEVEIDLALHTGMRWGEQYRLAWTNVDLIRNLIKIIRPKGGKDQHIPINPEARRALARLRAIAPQSLFGLPR
jgi:integrase